MTARANGEECIIRLANGGEIRCASADAEPDGTSYVRVMNARGVEVAYWDAAEWRDEPELVMAALCGRALTSGR